MSWVYMAIREKTKLSQLSLYKTDVGLTYIDLLVDVVPVETNDRNIDTVITDTG